MTEDERLQANQDAVLKDAGDRNTAEKLAAKGINLGIRALMLGPRAALWAFRGLLWLPEKVARALGMYR